MFKKLKDFTTEEQEVFYNIFSSEEYKNNIYMEIISNKLYRHNYCMVGNDLLEETLSFFEKYGLNVRIVETGRIQAEIELV